MANDAKKQAAAQAEALVKEQKMKASDMSKAILEAVDLLTDHKLEKLEFDKTLVCTIEDDTNKKKGEYVVTDGSTSFTAYSDVTIYMKGLRVYVNVPNGNFDNKKLITGRYIDSENAEYYTYKPPFEDYLDMSGNLIKDTIEKGLVANHATNKEIVIWQVDNFTQGKGYTLLGIKADFRSWLNSYKTKAGEYGLRLDIQSRETSTSQGEAKLKHYSCELTNNDMYGNPYNFETFYSQEKTFDISKISEIVSMKLVFFQKPGTFKDKDGKEIPYLFNGGDLPANLFVKNPYVSLGYAEQDFVEDTVLLMSLDSKTYDATSTKEQNTKTINARWIHFLKNEDGTDKDIVSIDYEDEIPTNAEIHWYRYYLAEGLDDELAGVFWDEIESNKNKLSYTFYPDINTEFERIKVIIENPSRNYIKLQKQLELNKINTDPTLDDGEKLIRKQEIEEDFSYESKVNYYESDIIVFENEKPVANPATVDLVNGLQISVDPADKGGLDGKYCIYGMDYKLLNSAEKERLRPLEATYASLVTGEPSLDKAAKITWKIPLQHTMIYPPTKGKEYLFENKNMDGTITKDEATIEFLFSDNVRVAATEDQLAKPDLYPESATHILITRDGTEDYTKSTDDTDSQQIEVKQYFRIKDIYQPGNSNNTIECIVVKNNIEYPASTNLTFGPQGTNGTDYTLTLEFDNNQTCLYAKNADGINVTAHLMDYENKPINDVTCTFSWYSGDSKKVTLSSGGMAANITVKSDYRNNTNLDYYILQGVVNYGKATQTNENGDKIEIPGVNLTAYLPIPIKYDNSFTLIEAPTTIIYDNNGTNPTYYKGGLKIYKEDQSKPFTGQNYFWQVITTDESGQENGYYPFIRDNENGISELIPTNSYYNKMKNGTPVPLTEIALQYCQFTEDSKVSVLWTQPILIRQNRWPSAMLNKWDGTLQIDEGKGTILSQMVGAGYKNDKNQFNGVLMGDANIALEKNPIDGSVKNQERHTGVYGFHEGAPSFGLMDNGTAFFGKAGHGQIFIDGNKSTIQSGNYKNGVGAATPNTNDAPGKQGMLIDLDDAKIDMQAVGSSTAYIKLDTQSPFLQIAADVNGSDKKIMHVGASDYYLQTTDYSSEDKTGLHFSLSNKSLIAYGKKRDDGTNGYVKMTANGAPYFQINDGTTDLFYAGQTNYYLQSSDYSSTDKTGLRFSLSGKSLIAYGQKDASGKNGFVKMTANGAPYFQIQHNNGKDLFYAGQSNYYLQSSDYKDTKLNTTTGLVAVGDEGAGFKISLSDNQILMNKGKITLNDIAKDDKGNQYMRSLILNSEAGTYPIRVNSNGLRMFSVSWGGTMYSQKADITGTITANDGKIGNWQIDDGAIKNGNVTLTANGNLIASNVTLSGTITATAGTIGGAIIKDNVLKIEDANLGTVHLTSLYLGNNKVTTKEISVVTDVDFFASHSSGAIANFKAADMTDDGLIKNRVEVYLYPLYIKCSRVTFTVLKCGTVKKDDDGVNAGNYCLTNG